MTYEDASKSNEAQMLDRALELAGGNKVEAVQLLFTAAALACSVFVAAEADPKEAAKKAAYRFRRMILNGARGIARGKTVN